MKRAALVMMLFMSSGMVGAAEKGKEAVKPAVSQGTLAVEVQAQKKTMMEKMQQLGGPSEGHKVLEPLVGNWTYDGQWWMSPDAPAESMKGTATNTLIFGGRFLREEVHAPAQGDQPAFEGLGFTGYDNIRKEYQTVWFDNMNTSMMRGAGKFDAATSTLTDEGDFSCPITGESHRWYRTDWKILDQNHATYESYSRTPEGREFKSLEIRYLRAQ